MQTESETTQTYWVRVLPWALVAVLLAINVATLLNARIHRTAYGAVNSVLGVLGDQLRLKVVSLSVSVMQEAQVVKTAGDIKARAERAETALRASSARARELEAESARLQRSLTRHRDIAARVGRDGIRVLATRSARAVATAPSRMAPYVGIPIEVGFLTWEVSSNCELAKSFAELSKEAEAEPEDVGTVCNWLEKIPTREKIWSEVKRSSSDGIRRVYGVLERVGHH
jgi:hypothetical protein